MSLVGTRPPTVDEWDKYELHHRARLATKPGLTGMWQVSGRSNITDFEEVVKLDKQYISEWTMGLDIKILFKTVQVVFKKEGWLNYFWKINRYGNWIDFEMEMSRIIQSLDKVRKDRDNKIKNDVEPNNAKKSLSYDEKVLSKTVSWIKKLESLLS